MRWTTAHRTSPKAGEQDNGDAVFVRPSDDALTLAVVDGLGHGPMAAAAAAAAVDCLARQPAAADVEQIMRAIHDVLRGTRGAAMAVCQLRLPTLTGARTTWLGPEPLELICCGVGNVEIRCVGAKLPILLSPGVLGARVQSFRVCRGELPRGARLVLFSDGISQRAPLDALRHLDAETLCDTLMREHRKPDDDATVLVCDTEA
ncbi:MAG TPA: SpoIIE family protein phosphatase [Nannocystis sp.]